jgi:hypothetical protein
LLLGERISTTVTNSSPLVVRISTRSSIRGTSQGIALSTGAAAIVATVPEVSLGAGAIRTTPTSDSRWRRGWGVIATDS